MLSKKLDAYRLASMKKKSIHSKHVHDHHSTIEHNVTGAFLRSAVYGGLDGIITTFAVVSGVAGAKLSAGIILIMGFANLIADGISMAVGDYLSSKAEKEYQEQERKREDWEITHYLAGEKKEMIDIYVKKGYSKEHATQIIELLASNKEAFTDQMMQDELGIQKNEENPIKNSLVTFGSFLLFGFIPLFAFVGAAVFGWFAKYAMTISIILTALTMFTLGAVKVKVTGKNWFKSGFEMLLVGGATALAAYGVGVLLGGMA